MAGISTHVLDLASGRPAAGVKIAFYQLEGERLHLGDFVTNADGRVDQPILAAEAMREGSFELVFSIGAYFNESSPFLQEIPVRFQVFDATAHYHVPLLVSPYGYQVYRGS